jgi:SpoVK/Ycf46/Vps4 family AAA+-type ATPase
LNKHFGKKCIVLVDEYDSPLNYALTRKIDPTEVEDIVNLLGNLLGSAFKGNPNL